MKRHKIPRGEPHNFTYKFLFNQISGVHTYLPAPTLFDVHSRGRYFVLESEARAHNAAVVAARQAEASAPRASVSYYSNHYAGYWLITKLGQKPKLGGVRVSHRLYIHVHTFQLSVFTLFHCIIHVKFIFSLSSCVFEKLWENPKTNFLLPFDFSS